LVQIELHRPHLGNGNIDPHVPFHPPNEHRIVNILLQHTLLVILKVVNVVNDGDASTTGQICRLADPLTPLIPIFVEEVYELLILVWHYKSQRSKIVHLAIELLHFLDDSRQIILGANRSRLRDMAKFLVRFCPFKLS
jgi:hypothetical protein